MIPVTLAQASQICSGQIVGARPDELITGNFLTDSRRLGPGDVFVAYRGGRFDGHDFLPMVKERRAALALVTRASAVEVPQLVVSDCTRALRDLARYVLDRVRGRVSVVGLSGSVGKTTCKNLIGQTLASLAPTVYTEGNLNNEIGFALTVLRVEENTRYLVLEYGASQIGDIAYLKTIANPDIAILLKIGRAHLGISGSLKQTLSMKAELVRSLPEGAQVALNLDDPLLAALAEEILSPKVLFGQAQSSDVRARSVTSGIDGLSVEVGVGGRFYPVRSRLIGLQHLPAILAAMAAFSLLNLDLADCARVLGRVKAAPGRMELLDSGKSLVLNDAYNASPESGASALLTLSRAGDSASRRVAILGPMFELGSAINASYRELAERVVRLNIDLVIVVEARALYLACVAEGTWNNQAVFFPKPDTRAILALLEPGDLVLVKAGHAAGFDRLARDLAARLEARDLGPKAGR